MRNLLAATLYRLARWLQAKSAPTALLGGQWTGTSYVDAYQRNRQPSPNELLADLKGTSWTCASINASVCASYPPRLYVATHADQPSPKCRTRALEPHMERRVRALPGLSPQHAKAAAIEEVVDHPLLTLLHQVNPVHNQFDLWELTTLYQEVHGSAYWYLS